MKTWLSLLFCLLSLSVCAAVDSYPFDSLEQEQTFRSLTEQLRCPKCQNNNIAESNSEIASDMRDKVFELLGNGYDKQQVVDYMVDRYGYFVTYDPPMTATVIFLWLSPLLFIGCALFIVIRHIRQRTASQAPLSQTEQERLNNLLDEQ